MSYRASLILLLVSNVVRAEPTPQFIWAENESLYDLSMVGGICLECDSALHRARVAITQLSTNLQFDASGRWVPGPTIWGPALIVQPFGLGEAEAGCPPFLPCGPLHGYATPESATQQWVWLAMFTEAAALQLGDPLPEGRYQVQVRLENRGTTAVVGRPISIIVQVKRPLRVKLPNAPAQLAKEKKLPTFITVGIADKSRVADLSQLSGTLTPQTVSAISVSIRQLSTGQLWDGSQWTRAGTNVQLPTTITGSQWSPAFKLPALGQSGYEIVLQPKGRTALPLRALTIRVNVKTL